MVALCGQCLAPARKVCICKARLRPGFFVSNQDFGPMPAPAAATAHASPWPCLQAHAQGCCLLLSVQPGAKRTEANGLHDGALRVRLAAPPVEGRANEALLHWLAEELKLPRRAPQLLSGATARRKRVLLPCDTAQAAAWLTGLLGPADG